MLVLISAALMALTGEGFSAATRAFPIIQAAETTTTRIVTWKYKNTVRTISLDEIEKLPRREIRIRSNWDAEEQTFEGVLLSDFLKFMQSEEVPAITVRGEDNYSAIIRRDEWLLYPIILATRVNGKTISRRDRGPMRIIYPKDQFPELDTSEYNNKWVWLITEIDAIWQDSAIK